MLQCTTAYRGISELYYKMYTNPIRFWRINGSFNTDRDVIAEEQKTKSIKYIKIQKFIHTSAAVEQLTNITQKTFI